MHPSAYPPQRVAIACVLALITLAYAGCAEDLKGASASAEALSPALMSMLADNRLLLRWTLPDYVDPGTLGDLGQRVEILSDGARTYGRTYPELATRSLVFVSSFPLERPPESVRANIELDGIRTYRGRSIEPPTSAQASWAVPLEPPDDHPARTYRFADDIAPLLAPCAPCHGAPRNIPPALTYTALREARSKRVPGAPLVVSRDPLRSRLLFVLLPDHPDRRGTLMPPPYAEAHPLPLDTLLAIEGWIRDGALP